MLQICGLNVDKNAVQRIEAGKRFVTDIELIYLSEVLAVPLDDLLDREKSGLFLGKPFPEKELHFLVPELAMNQATGTHPA